MKRRAKKIKIHKWEKTIGEFRNKADKPLSLPISKKFEPEVENVEKSLELAPSLSFMKTSPGEVKFLIRSLERTKALDNVSNLILKHIPE